ncbi:MAG: response regulator [Caldilineae bacterium]|nr:MAG: response regulator [Caldilineae bacterium]
MQEKILIADDEPYVLDVCKRILEKKYRVRIVHSGLEAIQLVQQEHFDLLLTDIKMPGIDGLETAKEVKKINPDIICITMTGFSTMETAIKALRLGVDEFVVKPFAPDELSLAIERALEKERLRQENIRLKSLLPLFEFNKSLMSTVDADLLLQQVLHIAQAETGSSSALLYMADAKGRLALLTHSDVPAEYLETVQTHVQSLVAQVEETTTERIVAAGQNPATDAMLAALNVKSVAAIPLPGKEKLLGVLVVLKQRATFTQSECNFLSVMAGQAAIAYENARLFEDLQLAYDELKTLDHMKSEFINIAAHELRTPLAILLGYASVLEEDAEGTQKEHLGIIVRNAMRLRGLIEDLLNMRYIESGQLQLNISDFEVADVVEQAISDLAMMARNKNITLRVDLPPDLPPLHSDRQKLELVVMNLLANAIKFTPPGGKVTVSGHADSHRLTMSVCDTGIGIPKKEFKRIFERFYQVENSLNREHEGIGLGLSIVKGMLERCGGEIEVESEVGKGSTFTFTLPLHLAG